MSLKNSFNIVLKLGFLFALSMVKIIIFCIVSEQLKSDKILLYEVHHNALLILWQSVFTLLLLVYEEGF